MLERTRRNGVRNMTDERNETMKEQMDGRANEEATEKLEKSDVDVVTGGAGKQGYDKPPELPEIL